MTASDVLHYMKARRYATQASVSETGAPQAAIIGVAVTDAFELVFDTLNTSRKYRNLRREPRIALTIGGDDDCCVQYEGLADEPKGAELETLKQVYFARFPDGLERERLPEIAYFRVKPLWIRFSDYRSAEPLVVEFGPRELGQA